jgi:hypothetical protein
VRLCLKKTEDKGEQRGGREGEEEEKEEEEGMKRTRTMRRMTGEGIMGTQPLSGFCFIPRRAETQVRKHLPQQAQALRSNHSTTKRKKKKERKRGGKGRKEERKERKREEEREREKT